MRTDSPTCDIEGFNIILSWVSCERLMVKSGDITNAYFQGCPLERLILMRQPPGGVLDVDISADTMFVARVPIYGTCDAGRGFWKKLRHDILSTGLKENAVIRALYIYQEDGEPKSMLATHVDDMLWATKPGYEDRVQQLRDRYTIKTVESGTFRFCGREVIQHSDFSVSVRCKDTTEKNEPVRYDLKGRLVFFCVVLKRVVVSWKESEVIFGSVCQELGVRTRHLEKFKVFFGNTVDVGLVFLIPVPLLSGVLVRVVLPQSRVVWTVFVLPSVSEYVWLKMS